MVRDEFQENFDKWTERNRELRDELRRREDEGLIPDSSSEFRNSPFFTDLNNNWDSNLNRPDSLIIPTANEGNLNRPDSPTILPVNEGNVFEGNTADTETYLGIKSVVNKVDGDNDSSSTNKKKLVEDEDFTT